MKKIKLLKNLGLVILAVLAFCTVSLLAPPVDATTASYKRMIALGLIDEVATPQQLGLDYLSREPVELLAASEAVLQEIYYANEEASQMPEDIRLGIPLGSNEPIRIGQLPNDTGTPARARGWYAIGLANPQGQPESISPGFAERMTNIEYRNGGDLPVLTDAGDAEKILLADASGSFLQARRIPLINLIAYNRRTGRTYLLPRVNANAFCRDVVNALRRDTWFRV